MGRPAVRCRRPDTVLTFGPDGITFHPDHIAVHRWVTQAWADRGCAARLLYAAPSTEHLAEFGEIYEKWDMYMSDDRPVGRARISSPCTRGSGMGARQEALRLAGAGHPDVRAHRHARCRGLCLQEESFVDALPTCPAPQRRWRQSGR